MSAVSAPPAPEPWHAVPPFSCISGFVPSAFGLLWYPGCSEECCLLYHFPLILVECKGDTSMNLRPNALSWRVSIVLGEHAQQLAADRRDALYASIRSIGLVFSNLLFPDWFSVEMMYCFPLFRLLSPPLLLSCYLLLLSVLLTFALSIQAIQQWTQRYLQLLGLLMNWPLHCYIITFVVYFIWCQCSYHPPFHLHRVSLFQRFTLSLWVFLKVQMSHS